MPNNRKKRNKMKYGIGLIAAVLLITASCKKNEEPFTAFRLAKPGTFTTLGGAELLCTAMKDSATKVKVFEVRIQGEFIGIEEQITRYGHCWSEDSTDVYLGDANYSDKGEKEADSNVLIFTSEFADLKKETKYYVRSYVVTEGGATGYNPEFYAFETKSLDDQWIEMQSLDGRGKQGGLSFTIDNGENEIGYFGFATEGLIPSNKLWSFDPSEGTGSWTPISSSPMVSRKNAVAFAVGTKAYIGLGEDINGDPLSDFWEYNSTTDLWNEVAPLGGFGIKLTNAVAFAINDKGYVGTGAFGSPIDDFWEYDPVLNTWTPIAPFGGGRRTGAVAFVIGQSAFVGMGIDINGNYSADMWEFNAEHGTWTKRSDFPGGGRTDAVAIGINSEEEGYVGLGASMDGETEVLHKDFYLYNPYDDVWEKRMEFPGGVRKGAAATYIENKAYVAWGYGSTDYATYSLFSDIFEYSR